MEGKRLEQLINRVEKNILEKDFSEENRLKRVSQYSDENGKVDLYETAAYAQEESRLYAKFLLADTLNELRKEGYLHKHDQ